jgi:hypothetical protein
MPAPQIARAASMPEGSAELAANETKEKETGWGTTFHRLQKKLGTDEVMSKEMTRSFYGHQAKLTDSSMVCLIPVVVVMLPIMLPFQPYRDGAVANWMFTVVYNLIVCTVCMSLFTQVFLNLVFVDWTRREFLRLLSLAVFVFMIVTWIIFACGVYPIPYSSASVGTVPVVVMLTTAWWRTPKEKRQTPEFRKQILAANDTITFLVLYYFAYLFYGSAFVQLEGTQQALFAFLSPVLKLVFRRVSL